MFMASLAGAEPRAELRTLRYLSQIIRDHPPSPPEAKAVYSGEKTVEQLRDEWLSTPEHKARVARFFADMLGAPNFFFVNEDAYFLEQNPDGIWYSKVKGACSSASAVSQTAWWTAGGTETIAICPNIVSTQMSVTVNSSYFGCNWLDGFLKPGCGCGPDQILCTPKIMRSDLAQDLAREFQDRAVYVYEAQLTWNDLFSSPAVYGNRAMAQFYLLNQYVYPWQLAPPAAELLKLKQIPLQEKTWFEAAQIGAQRAGVVTSPAFMRRYNNGRSRVRALTDALLCHDVDGSLNRRGISQLVNPDVNPLGVSIVSRPECATCHFGMDNLASTIFGWNDQGSYERWPKQLSQLGHGFGEAIEGPQALMESYLQRGPGFQECMSKKAWEDVSGRPWSALSTTEQSDFLTASSQSPYTLLMTIFQSNALLSARGGSEASPIKNSSSLSFADDINPILEESCSGYACHNAESSLGTQYQFIGNEEGFRKASVLRLQDGSMPPAGSGKTLPDSAKAQLLLFLKQP